MDSNVVEFRKVKKAEETFTEDSFDEVAKRNAENEKRLREERAKANKAVLRCYRIKN